MENILDSQEIQESQKHYAGFWIRFAATFIDGILLNIVNYALVYIIAGSFTAEPFSTEYYITLGLNVIIGISYYCGMESSVKQGTLGKMAVGIKVGTPSGDRISFANALGRYFAKILSALTIFIGFMMVGWDKKKQGLHDKIAGTIVFYGN